MLRKGFFQKKFKPRLVPDAPKSFPRAIHPEELPETPAERLVRLTKSKTDKKAPKGEHRRQTRKGLDKNASDDETHLALGEDLDSTDEEGKFRDDIEGNNDDPLEGTDHEKLLDSEQKQQDSPPLVSVEIQIEPPLDELPVDVQGEADREGLLTEGGVVGAPDEAVSKDKKSKKEKKKKDKDKTKSEDDAAEDDASKDASPGGEKQDEAERGKEKRKRSIFARSE